MLLLEGAVPPEFLCRKPEDVVLLKKGRSLAYVGRQGCHRLRGGEVSRDLGIGDQWAAGHLKGQLLRLINNERAFVVIRIDAGPIDEQLRVDTDILVDLAHGSELASSRRRGRCSQQAGERQRADARGEAHQPARNHRALTSFQSRDIEDIKQCHGQFPRSVLAEASSGRKYPIGSVMLRSTVTPDQRLNR
jgi:hypothetical protein